MEGRTLESSLREGIYLNGVSQTYETYNNALTWTLRIALAVTTGAASALTIIKDHKTEVTWTVVAFAVSTGLVSALQGLLKFQEKAQQFRLRSFVLLCPSLHLEFPPPAAVRPLKYVPESVNRRLQSEARAHLLDLDDLVRLRQEQSKKLFGGDYPL